MITKNMVKTGLDVGLIKLIMSPNSDGVVCKIGDEDGWFYFGGLEAENANTVEEYKENIPMDVIIADIFNVLEEFRRYGKEFLDEYRYYDAYLKEHGISDC